MGSKNNKLILFFLLGFILSSTATLLADFPEIQLSPTTHKSALTCYEEGYNYYKQGKFEQSEKSFLNALRLEPNLIKAHYWLGKLYREKGQLKDAIFHWNEVARLKKLVHDRRIALSFLNNETPSTPQTIKVIQQKKDAEKAFEKGLLFIDKGHWEGAEVELRKAVSLYPANRDYLIKLARLLWDKHEHQASVKYYRNLMNFNFVSFADFKEGMSKIIKSNMFFLIAPLIEKQRKRFSKYPKFRYYAKLIKPVERIKPVSAGKVIKRMDGQVLLDIGFSKGLNLSDEFSLSLRAFSPGTPIIDDDTGNIIGRTEDKITADLMITKVFRQSSWALIRKEFNSGVKAGDLIEIKKTEN